MKHIKSNFSIEGTLVSRGDDNKDFWGKLFFDPFIRYLIGPIATLTFLCTIIGLLGIITFNRGKHIKTVISHCEAIIHSYVLSYLLLSFSIDLIRIYYGPFSSMTCWWYIYFKNFSVLGGQLGFILTLTTRYFSIIKKMNILGCSDEFFNIFLNMEVFWITFTLALLNNIVPGKMGINYYICTGEDPEFYQALGSKAPVASLLHPFSLMTTVYISYKTYSIRKRIDYQNQEAQAKIQIEDPTAKYFPTVNKFSRSTIDLISLYGGMGLIVFDSILWNSKPKNMTAIEIMTTFEGKFCILLHHYLIPLTLYYCGLIHNYGRNKDLQEHLKTQIHEISDFVKKWKS